MAEENYDKEKQVAVNWLFTNEAMNFIHESFGVIKEHSLEEKTQNIKDRLFKVLDEEECNNGIALVAIAEVLVDIFASHPAILNVEFHKQYSNERYNDGKRTAR